METFMGIVAITAQLCLFAIIFHGLYTCFSVKKPEKKCEHEWIDDNQILLSNPPIQRSQCRKCGEESYRTIGVYQEYKLSGGM